MQSIFRDLVPIPPVEVEKLAKECSRDTSPEKIDLVTGAFYTADSQVWILPLVKEIDETLAGDRTLDYDYLWPYGLESFTCAATSSLLGVNNNTSSIFDGQTAFGIQSLGGTGALFLGLDFLMKALQRTVVYSSDPSWDNYEYLFKSTGFRDTRTYRYWHVNNKCLDFQGMREDLNRAPENAIILLQVCGHNPTGCDPTREQWMEISNIIKKRKLFPFFDCAYLGFASGDVDEDAWVVRYFASQGHELFCALSFSKTFALYGLRVGCLVVVVNDEASSGVMESYFMTQIRGAYMTPPFQGARIVSRALNTPQYMDEWRRSIRCRYEQIVRLRKCLRERLEAKTRPGLWKCVTDQVGLFAYIGLPVEVIEVLKKKYHIYVPPMPLGRINVPSLTENNVDYIADAIAETLAESKQSGRKISYT